MNWVNQIVNTKCFYHPAAKKAVVAYIATDMHDPKRKWSDLKSDFNIMIVIGREKHDNTQNAKTQFQQAADKYMNQVRDYMKLQS